MLDTFSAEEIRKRVAERLADPDVAGWPNLVHVRHYRSLLEQRKPPGMEQRRDRVDLGLGGGVVRVRPHHGEIGRASCRERV